MRAVRVRIADALHDGQMPGVVKVLESGQRVVKADVAVQFQDLLRRQAEFRARVVVIIVAYRARRY